MKDNHFQMIDKPVERSGMFKMLTILSTPFHMDGGQPEMLSSVLCPLLQGIL